MDPSKKLRRWLTQAVERKAPPRFIEILTIQLRAAESRAAAERDAEREARTQEKALRILQRGAERDAKREARIQEKALRIFRRDVEREARVQQQRAAESRTTAEREARIQKKALRIFHRRTSR